VASRSPAGGGFAVPIRLVAFLPLLVGIFLGRLARRVGAAGRPLRGLLAGFVAAALLVERAVVAVVGWARGPGRMTARAGTAFGCSHSP
jgi:hypothetical protein